MIETKVAIAFMMNLASGDCDDSSSAGRESPLP